MDRQSILYGLHPFSALASLVILFLHLKNSIEVMEGIEEEEKNLALPVGKLEVTYRCVTPTESGIKTAVSPSFLISKNIELFLLLAF